ncbi:hypothetical protein ACIBJC_24265 [Streptomyces sp. NPDC050509]|uniref:hypothetical protein n=1 Tax=Streptomyces sp. NPDC050509 TaxID=3365620 RepID=UPI0037A50574
MGDRETRRSGYPLTIPEALLNSDVMRRACAVRDFQEIFRLVNRRTGSSHAAIAAAVGKMTSSRVSDVIRGARGIRGQQVIERVADGFGIPGDMLGLPRRPWEGSPENIDRPGCPDYAAPDQEMRTDPLPPASDVVLVSLWIEGRRRVVAVNRRTLLTGAVGAAAHGPYPMVAPTTYEIPDLEPAPLPKFDDMRVEAAIEHLGEMWHVLVKADNLFGPRHTLASVHQQISLLETLLENARSDQRIDLLRLAAQYGESAAWLHEDSVDIQSAAKWTSRAMEWATESGDQAMVAWTLFRKSQQATTRKNAAQTISLARAAQRSGLTLTKPMRAAAMQQEAHGYALDGNEVACHRLLDDAHGFAALSETKGDARSGHGDFCTPSYLEIQRANCWLTLDRPDLAAPVFERALAELPGAYQRDRGLAQARLAMAYAGIKAYDEAATQATSALDIARSSGSARTMDETMAAANTLRAAPASRAVSELLETIKEESGF